MRTTNRRRLRGGAGSHRARDGSAGFTLVEYTVSMAIFTVVIAITISGVALMSRDVVKTTNLSTSTDQIRQAFTRLDRQVRYAHAVNRAGRNAAGTIWYVEFQGLDSGGIDTCHQWRLDTATDLLQQREWVPAPTPASLPGWTTVASNMANDTTTAQAPFAFVPATTDVPLQGLDVTLIGKRTSANTATVTLQTSLTARNSSVSSATNDDADNDGSSDNPVCTFGTGVPRP